MRSPVIAFSILAAAAVSPTLVAGAPTPPAPGSPQLSEAIAHPDAAVRHNIRGHPTENAAANAGGGDGSLESSTFGGNVSEGSTPIMGGSDTDNITNMTLPDGDNGNGSGPGGNTSTGFGTDAGGTITTDDPRTGQTGDARGGRT